MAKQWLSTKHVQSADGPTQTVEVQELSCCKLCTAYSEALQPPLGRTQEPNAETAQTVPDRCSTDPEPDMKMRQAHFHNMRSKCRCSCVLQFTRHHGVSSVLHRPPSQMIHCIVLCFQILRLTSRDCVKRGTETMFGDALPNRGGGDHKPVSRRELFEPFETSQDSRKNGEMGMVPQQSRAILTHDDRQ